MCCGIFVCVRMSDISFGYAMHMSESFLDIERGLLGRIFSERRLCSSLWVDLPLRVFFYTDIYLDHKKTEGVSKKQRVTKIRWVKPQNVASKCAHLKMKFCLCIYCIYLYTYIRVSKRLPDDPSTPCRSVCMSFGAAPKPLKPPPASRPSKADWHNAIFLQT